MREIKCVKIIFSVYLIQYFYVFICSKLIIVLRENIKNVLNIEKDQMLCMMKSLKYIMKFITRSRYLFSQ